MSDRLQGKVALVTGGASGIGAATVRAFAEQGAAVAILDRDATGAQRLVDELKEAGANALPLVADISCETAFVTALETAISHFGRLDILDNNAADLSLLAEDDELLNTDPAVWRRTYEANQHSAMLACKTVLPQMLEQGGGVIINIGSVDGELGDNTRFAYGMSKAALHQLTRSIATTYGQRGIRCNAIVPGLVMTEMAKQAVDEAAEAIWRSNIPSPELGRPEQLAQVAVFLASDDAAYINGQLLRVDGGMLSHVPHLAQFSELQKS